VYIYVIFKVLYAVVMRIAVKQTSIFQTFPLAHHCNIKGIYARDTALKMLLTYSSYFYNLTFLRLQFIYSTLVELDRKSVV
jgi:hypothetical protein